VGRKLLERLRTQCLLITLGEEGMMLFEKGGRIFQIPTVAQEVFDVSGAGDTVIAVFGLALGAGATFAEAALLSNLAAGVVVGKLGTATLTQEELIETFEGGASR
jgi:D-beta-D-heptose 7-phosphate kinase/D-beta-D-heptose 1-phosphate adenosyltransferase